MIIFGTRGVTYTKNRGSFFCPNCGGEQPYDLKRVRRFFTLYFIPVIPLDVVAQFIECPRCRGQFREEVLSYDPRAAQQKFQADFHEVMRKVMIRVMLADGDIGDSEIETIRRIYGQLVEREVPESQIRHEVERVEAAGAKIFDDLREVGNILNEHGKEMVVRAAVMVAAADGFLQDDEKKLLTDIARALNMSPAHFRGILTDQGESE